MAARKLQGEIERTLKKVQEGLEIFHETLEKLNTTSTANQKEKVESDLKKEIKKLQRLRDQIKGWQQLSEIKDKNALNEARKSIETEMERFKVLEKEMKIKAFSKEGLSQSTKLDPREKERLELVEWISEAVDRLNTGVDAFEAEMESLRLGAKKGSSRKLEPGKQARLDAILRHVERHRHHIKKLEMIRRLLENERLEIEDIKALQEDIDYYLEAHQEPDFVENEELYDDLDLIATSNSDAESDPGAGLDEEEPKQAVPPAPVLKSPAATKPTVAAPVTRATIKVVDTTKPPVPPPAAVAAKPAPLPAVSPKIAGPSFASAALASSPAAAPSAAPSVVVSQPQSAPASATSPPISFAAIAKPTPDAHSAVNHQHHHHHRPAVGYEELMAQLSSVAARAPRSRADLLSAISTSFQNCPDGYEAESSRSFVPPNPVPIPEYYPASPPAILENPAIFERLDLDTLFFIFYYQQKSYAQYLAARELKRQSWRFHKKYLTWFQRHEEPKSITDEYEQGTYIYFDFETSWCQRKKTEFTFEYRFLEDEESV